MTSIDGPATILLYSVTAIGIALLTYALLRPAFRALQSGMRTEAAGEVSGSEKIPIWVLVPGALLAAATVVLIAEAYFGLPVPGVLQKFTAGGNVAQARVADNRMPAWYTWRTDLAPGTPVGGPYGNFTTGDLIFQVPNLTLLRLGPAGPASVQPQEGDELWLANAGPWDESKHAVMGLNAVFADGQWHIDTEKMLPVNSNNEFRSGERADPMPGYATRPADANITVTRMEDAEGPFVRVNINATTAFVQIQGSAPLSSFDGVPVTIRGQIRAHTAGEFNLTIWDIVGDSGKSVSSVTRRPATGDWTTLFVRSQSVVYPSPDDYFAIGLVTVDAGDWFDVRELSVFKGTI